METPCVGEKAPKVATPRVSALKLPHNTDMLLVVPDVMLAKFNFIINPCVNLVLRERERYGGKGGQGEKERGF